MTENGLAMRSNALFMSAASMMLLWTVGALVPGAVVVGQTITVVGTPHLTGLAQATTEEQLLAVVDRMAVFKPTQVCVERMGGERIQAQLADPRQHGMTFQPETHGRPLATVIVPAGFEMQAKLERGPVDARREAAELYRALARGPEERVLFIVGAAHRPFTEAELRSQPWFEVRASLEFFADEAQ